MEKYFKTVAWHNVPLGGVVCTDDWGLVMKIEEINLEVEEYQGVYDGVMLKGGYFVAIDNGEYVEMEAVYKAVAK